MKSISKVKREPLKSVGIRQAVKIRLRKYVNKQGPFVVESDIVSVAVDKYLDNVSGKSDGLPSDELGARKRRRPVAADTESLPRP